MESTTRFEHVDINELIPYVRNARTHSKEQITQLRGSLREFGFVNPILIDGENNVIAGHGRLEAAKAEGMTSVPCVYVEHLTEAQKRAYVLADNRLAMNAGWDEEMLALELGELADLDFNLGILGFDQSELEKLLEDSRQEVEEDDFDMTAALEEATFVESGDVWTLGQHRLVCGDATDPKAVELLMDGKQASLIVTDPPYNVAYEGGTGLSIKNDKMVGDSFLTFLGAAFKNVFDHTVKGGAAYIFHADSEGERFRNAFVTAGFKLSQCLVWVKNSFVMGRQDYHWQHEPILYGTKKGAAHYFIDDRTQSTVIEKEKPNIKKMKKDELVKFITETLTPQEDATTVLRFDKPPKNDMHPTMKPLALCGRLIRNSSRAGELVIDTFGGSGSTLMACEQLDRSCHTMELDEKYASVILRRFAESYGGETITCLRNGETFSYSDLVKEVESG